MPKCRICKESFTRSRPLQAICSKFECAVELANRSQAKRLAKELKIEKKQTIERKEKLKTRSKWIKEAQSAFNAYIRERDKDKLCICCPTPLSSAQIGGGFDCGHYRSVGSAPHLRFDPNNAHGQTKKCNRWGSGRAVDYRIGLIARIGLEAVEALEADNTIHKWTIDELRAIKAFYVAKLKELKDRI